MNRQRILLMVVGGLGALALGRTVVGFYVDTLNSRKEEIRLLEKKRDQLRLAKAQSEEDAKAWRKLGSQTLAVDPNEAMRRLRDELFAIAKKSGIEKDRVDMGAVQNLGRNGIRVLSCAVSGEGSTENVVRFLYTLYRRPYLVRIKSLILTQVIEGKKTVRGHLKMTARLDTPLLPPNVKVPTITPFDPKDKDTQVDRTKFASLDDYKTIIDRRIWEPYVPPMPGKPTNPTPAQNAQDLDPNNVKLTWTAGANAEKHQIFFGEGSPSAPIGTQKNTELIRSGLKPGVRYAWRVDEVSEGGTTPGEVWSFTTKGAQQPPTQVVQNQQNAQPPPPPPPPTDGNMVLARVLSSPGKQQAILMDAAAYQASQAPGPAGANAVDKRVEVGDSFFGGTLVYIHSRGAVSERDEKLRFHAIGAPLSQGQPLTETDQPEIWHELRKLQVQAAGISERPG